MSSIRCFRRTRYQKLQPAADFLGGTKVMEKAGGCTSTILERVNHSKGKKPTLFHLSRPTQKVAGHFLEHPDQGKQHYQTISICRNPYDCMTADATAPWRFTSFPGQIHIYTDDLSHRDKQHFQTTVTHLHYALILCPQKRWGQRVTNVANSVLHMLVERNHTRECLRHC